MPWLQRMGTEASSAGSYEAIGEMKRRLDDKYGELVEPPAFSEFLGEVIGRSLDGDEAAYVDAIPPGIAESVRAGIRDAVRREVPIFVQWTPAYDYQASLWEAKAGATSGGLIVQISGPYPGGPAGS